MRRTIVYVGMSKKSNTAKSRNYNHKLLGTLNFVVIYSIIFNVI